MNHEPLTQDLSHCLAWEHGHGGGKSALNQAGWRFDPGSEVG